MSLLERVKNICLTPNTEWPVIAGEATPAGSLITGYVAPLAAIAAAAGFVGGSLIGRTLPFVGTYRVPFVAGVGADVARPSDRCRRTNSIPIQRPSEVAGPGGALPCRGGAVPKG